VGRPGGGPQHAARNYAIVTAAYWGFTLTDGALRMLVLLHFYRLGYSPFTLAFLFLLYEAAGRAGEPGRRLAGDATRHPRMLTVGLVTQILGFTAAVRCSTPDGRRRWRWPGWWWRRAFAASPRT
jgi:hypothetical protein